MTPPPETRPSRDDKVVSQYIGQLRRRYPEFYRTHIEDLKQMSHDLLSRMVTEHIVLGQRSALELFLQGMLTAEEQDLLHSDPQFTLAWRIFVDLCWMRKQIKRGALIVAGIVIVMAAVVIFILAMPHVAKGPVPR